MDSDPSQSFEELTVSRLKRPRASAALRRQDVARTGEDPRSTTTSDSKKKTKKKAKRNEEVRGQVKPTKSARDHPSTVLLAATNVSSADLREENNDLDVEPPTTTPSTKGRMQSADRGTMPSTNGASPSAKQPSTVAHVELNVDGWARLELSGRGLTCLLNAVGARGVRVEQCYNLSKLSRSGRVHALIMLYKWNIDRGDTFRWNPSSAVIAGGDTSFGGGLDDIMLISEVINSGSATQAVVSALLNMRESADPGSGFRLGDRLLDLRSFLRPLPHAVRGSAICSADIVRTAHYVAAAEFPGDSSMEIPAEIRPSEDFWMYSIFMPGQSGRWVYELKGCADEPVVLGHLDSDAEEIPPENDWLDLASEAVMKHVEEFRDHHIRFQLYAIIDDREDQGEELQDESMGLNSQDDAQGTLSANGDIYGEFVSEDIRRMEPFVKMLKREMRLNPEVHRLVATFNYDTFLIEMCKLMASRGDLHRRIGSSHTSNGVVGEGNASPTSS